MAKALNVVKLRVVGQSVHVLNADKGTIRALDEATSYQVEGRRFQRAYRMGAWDGKEHLLKEHADKGWRGPVGIIGELKRVLDEEKQPYIVKVAKIHPPNYVDFNWNTNIKLRPYQKLAVKSFFSKPNVCRGILKMPIRSGKTKTAAAIIHRVGRRTIFMVPSQLLLRQTARALADALPGASIGVIGDGDWYEGDVTVATIQSLAVARGGIRRCKGNVGGDGPCICGRKTCRGRQKYIQPPTKRYTNLLTSYDLVVFDETHHMTAETWREVAMDFPAPYRLGLTATAYFDNAKEISKGIIWLRGICGDIKIDVNVSDLIEQGYLMRQHVRMYRVTKPKTLVDLKTWSSRILSQLIVNNDYRNRKIARLAIEAINEGMPTIIASGRIKQIRAISAILKSHGIKPIIVTGHTPGSKRERILNKFQSGEYPLILGTVFTEGIDLPEAECVINAEGGKAPVPTVQRMRNMTPNKGKTRSVLIDFYDETNSYLKYHSQTRYKIYSSEPAFIVEMV
jgi:superfamily II DNA or RNA helicase